MTRHARNSTGLLATQNHLIFHCKRFLFFEKAGSVYTYHEKKKDAASSGFGTERQRLAKDSVKTFDACNLTLQPARLPVVTKDGYLFDREAILQYIITKKGEYARKMKEFERQKNDDVKELEAVAKAENKKKLEKFVKIEKNIQVGSSKRQSSLALTKQFTDSSF